MHVEENETYAYAADSSNSCGRWKNTEYSKKQNLNKNCLNSIRSTKSDFVKEMKWKKLMTEG